MTRCNICDIIICMRKILGALAMMVLPWSAWAEERIVDLGFAQPGMAQAQFRDFGWNGRQVICSDEANHPREVDFSVSKGVARVGAIRCGLFAADSAGQLRPHPHMVAGWPAEIWALFLPDAAGTPRLVHLKLNLPAAAFDDLAKEWAHELGLPTYRRDKVVHWSNSRSDAMIVGDGDTQVHAYVMDNDLHDSANRRLGQMPARH